MLGYDSDGEPIALPETAVGWRVRRSPKRGQPTTIPGYDGSPLVVSMYSGDQQLTAEHLLEILTELDQNEPGRYRLDAVDDSGKTCCSTPAYWTMPGSAGNNASRAGMDLEKALASAINSNEKIVKTVCDAMKTLSTQFAAAMESSAKAATVRAAHAVPEANDDDDDDKQRNTVDWTPLVQACAPIATKLGEFAAMQAISAVTKPKQVGN